MDLDNIERVVDECMRVLREYCAEERAKHGNPIATLTGPSSADYPYSDLQGAAVAPRF